MHTHETEIWNELNTYMMWVAIDYDYLPPEYDGDICTHRGELQISEVKLLEMEGYGQNGHILYNKARRNIDPAWVEMVDYLLYHVVNDGVDDWTGIADELVEAACNA
jgi:hypothetical protein